MILRPYSSGKATTIRYEGLEDNLTAFIGVRAPSMSSGDSLDQNLTASIKTSPLSRPIKLRAANSCTLDGEASLHRPEVANLKFEPIE